MRNCTKYGGCLTKEPNRPSSDNPHVNNAKFPTVQDCKDRIVELESWIRQTTDKEGVSYLKEQVKFMHGLIKDALKINRL